MKKIFIDEFIEETTETVVIKGEDYRHLKVFRVKPDDRFIITGKENNEFHARIKDINHDSITMQIIERFSRTNDKYYKLTLYFAVLKGDKNEFIIQKATEIGIDSLVPVITDRTIVDLNSEKQTSRQNRWQKTAKEAAMQSGVTSIPNVKPIVKFKSVLEDNEHRLKFYGEINGDTGFDLSSLSNTGESIAVFIGPEGDFSEKEFELLKQNGWKGVGFNTGILKSDTAAIYTISVLNYLLTNR